MTQGLAGKTLLITGASRGIGKAIALRAARDGANIGVIGKTKTEHAKLKGTVQSACEEIESLGGQALACIADVRFEEQIEEAVAATAARFGGIDILVNNASAISLSPTASTELKRFDLMFQVNARATFAASKACLPWLTRSNNAHILTLSPPLNLDPRWFAPHVAYTITKYSMSLCTLGMAHEFSPVGIAVNSLWPRTVIATAAIENLPGGPALIQHCRRPEIVADAAHHILCRNSREFTGQFCIDEDILRAAGVADFSAYAVDPSVEPTLDLFL